MTIITPYGGTAQIGGIILHILDKDTSIFGDFGQAFDDYMSFFGAFMPPRRFSAIRDLMILNILPSNDIPYFKGLYRKDYSQHAKMDIHDNTLDGIVISHPHMDHVGMVHFVDKDTPLYMSEPCFWVLDAYQTSAQVNFGEFIDFRLSFGLVPKAKGKGYKMLTEERKPRPIKFMEHGKRFSIKDIEIESYFVDHSIPGSMSQIFFTSAGPIVYTGDIRRRGHHSDLTDEFIETAAKYKPLAMFCDGTRIESHNTFTEKNIFEEALEIAKQTKGIVLVEYPPRDLDRLLTFYEVAEATGRKLVINHDQALLLDNFDESTPYIYPESLDKNIRIFLPRKKYGFLDQEFQEEITNAEDLVSHDYYIWEREFINHPNRVSMDQLKADPDKYLMFLPYYDFNNLFDMDLEDCVFIRSITEPFDERSADEDRRRRHWLEYFDIPIKQLHISGHLNYDEIKDMVQRINPKILIPIHTEHPELYPEFHSNVLFPEKGVPIHL